MAVGALVGVMGVLTVVAIYFWLLRGKSAEQQDVQ
jgi:hypothetical protein